VGELVGTIGFKVGAFVGFATGDGVIGANVGDLVGLVVVTGELVGAIGLTVGTFVGLATGDGVNTGLGVVTGELVGFTVDVTGAGVLV
jgi:hypothetical protein